MNTHESSMWIEPASDHEIAHPIALLETATDQIESGETINSSPVLAAPPAFEDWGGSHLTALDDW